MTDIFVSYKSDDREVVHDIVKALEGEGFSVWWDQGIAPSSDWRATITEKLQAARCVLVVWSTNSIDNRTSRWVLQEAEAADKRDVYVPVSIDDVVPPLGLGHIQSADLIDWRGDTKDPRWLALVEVVRAKIEGRSADTAIAHRWEPADLAQVLKGRWPLVALLFGLASLVVAISLNFGITHAIGVVVGIASLYAALNALLARRMNERAASTFFRRLLRPSPVTYSAIAIVWLAVALVAASPLIRSMLYADFSVTVVDEVSRPVTGAIVVIDSQTGSESVTLDGQAIARVAYFRFSYRGVLVRVTYDGRTVEIENNRQVDGRLGDVTARIWSGQNIFRVAHWTAEELAIDVLARGHIPPAVKSLFPNVTTVLTNPVWHEVTDFLSAFRALGGDDVTYFGHAIDGGDTQPVKADSRVETTNLRWPREVDIDVARSGDIRGELFVRSESGLLAPGFKVILSVPESQYAYEKAMPKGAARELLRAGLDANYFDEDGNLPVAFSRDFDRASLEALLSSRAVTIERGQYFSDVDARRYLRYFLRKGSPPGFVRGRLQVLGRSGCAGESDGAWKESMKISGPKPLLRVTVIENSIDRNIPISAIVYGISPSEAMRPIGQPRAKEQLIQNDPQPGGVLRPGEALVVLRQLLFELPAASGSEPVLPGHDDTLFEFELKERVYRKGTPGTMSPTGTKPQAFAINGGRFVKENPVGDEGSAPANARRFVAGPSIDSVDVVVNGVRVPARDDTGRTLAMHAGQEWGSCPFVFARHEGQTAFRNHGMTIPDHIGASSEAAHRLTLGRRVNAIEVRELEEEISHLNAARLIITTATGETRIYPALEPRLAHVDDRYVTLKRDDVLGLDFGYTPRSDSEVVTIEVTGWYEPLPAPLAHRSRPFMARR